MKSVKRMVNLSVLTVFALVLAFPMSNCLADMKKGSISVSEKTHKSEYPDLAKISMQDAINKAQAEYPGKLLDVELEEEDGYLVYKIEIVGKDKVVKELDVDAGNGQILKIEKEDDED